MAINKEIKGNVVNIFTMETLELVPSKSNSKPYPPNVKPLVELVSLKAGSPPLTKLLNNLLYKVVLVKDYESAL